MEDRMSEAPKEIYNPRTGQRMKFIETRPDLLRIESRNPSGGEREPVHVHPKQASGAEVTSGSLVFEIEGHQRRLTTGDSITIPANTPHRFWNEEPEEAKSIQFFEPALDIAAFFETLFALAAADELDSKGMPRPLQLALLIPAFGDEIRPVSPPWPLLWALSVVLGPVARVRGHQAKIRAPAV
jgi:mannose-6-phosphate isomerase-like protein (cupin superfamily)